MFTGSPEANSGATQDRRAQSSGGKTKKEAGSLPVLPPKIDRQKKPSKKSAAERLFGRSSGDKDKSNTGGGGGATEDGHGEETAEETPPEARVTTGGFHSMPPSVSENNKKNTYDSNSSSNFDSYNKHAAAEGGFNGYSRSLSQPGYAASGPRGPTDKYR